ESVIFIDKSKESVQVIKENLKRTDLAEHAEVYINDAARAIKALAKRGLQFDLVLLDPPYNMHIEELIQTIDQLDLLAPNADIVVEHDISHEYPEEIGRCKQIRSTGYGDTAVTYYEYQTDR